MCRLNNCVSIHIFSARPPRQPCARAHRMNCTVWFVVDVSMNISHFDKRTIVDNDSGTMVTHLLSLPQLVLIKFIFSNHIGYILCLFNKFPVFRMKRWKREWHCNYIKGCRTHQKTRRPTIASDDDFESDELFAFCIIWAAVWFTGT